MAEPIPLRDLIGRNAVDADGNKVGKVGQIYVDDETGEPQWITVRTGMFGGSRENFAPLAGCRMDGDELVLAVSKDVVKGAPDLDTGGHLAENDNDALFEYYAAFLGTGRARGTGFAGAGDDAGWNGGEAIIRSEERLHIGTERVVAGRARLRKYVVTETVTQTVGLRHEEVRIEREPITDANRDAALHRGNLTEQEYEVILHSERPVVSKETVPVERVRLQTETVTEQIDITTPVRKEQIDGLEMVEGTHS